MMRKFALALGGAALFLGALGTGAPAQSAGVKVGMLNCNVSAGWGFVFGSSRSLRCVFSPHPGHVEHYVGTISKFGVDIGYTQSAVMLWGVIAPTANIAPGALAGNYVGATGSATVGIGAGANVLVGGSNRTITLQPVSIEGNTGFNVAAGVAALALRYQR
jgi:Protein of unknown function (DUF992)